MSGPVWTVRVRADGDRTARAQARGFSWCVGPPLNFGAEDQEASALEAAVGALGADLVMGFSRLCAKRRIALDAAEIALTVRLENALTHIGVVGESGDPAIAEIRGTFYVAATAEPDLLRELWADAQARSPLASTFRRATRLDLTLSEL